MKMFTFFRQFCTIRARELLKPGTVIKVNNLPHKVIAITFGKRGKGGGFIKTKLKNIISLNSFEKTFNSDELIEELVVEKVKLTFSWLDNEELVFISSNNYEEIRVVKDLIHNYSLLGEGEDYRVVKCEGKYIGVELPNICNCTVVNISFETKGLVLPSYLSFFLSKFSFYLLLFLSFLVGFHVQRY